MEINKLMRINLAMQQYLKQSCQNDGDKVFLFGSRVDDNKRGGDIDIFILSDKKYTLQVLNKIKTGFMQRFGWQKLDLVNWTFKEKNTFKDLVADEAIEL